MPPHSFMKSFLDVPKLSKKMIDLLLDCYENHQKDPYIPCTKSLSASLGRLFQRKLVDIKSFQIDGRDVKSFYITEKGKLYVTEMIYKKRSDIPISPEA